MFSLPAKHGSHDEQLSLIQVIPTRSPTCKFLTELPTFVMIPTPIAIEKYEYDMCQYYRHRRRIEDTLHEKEDTKLMKSLSLPS